jgi:hypothetical protein
MDRRRLHQAGGGQSLIFLFPTNGLVIYASRFRDDIRIMWRLTNRDCTYLFFNSGVCTSFPFSGMFLRRGTITVSPDLGFLRFSVPGTISHTGASCRVAPQSRVFAHRGPSHLPDRDSGSVLRESVKPSSKFCTRRRNPKPVQGDLNEWYYSLPLYLCRQNFAGSVISFSAVGKIVPDRFPDSWLPIFSLPWRWSQCSGGAPWTKNIVSPEWREVLIPWRL